MKTPKGHYPGPFEQMVLLALTRLGEGAYGMTIRREIEELAGRAVSIGAVYATLERLQEKRYIESRVSEPTAVRGGRSKRHYRLRREGVLALRRSKELFDRMWKSVRLQAPSRTR